MSDVQRLARMDPDCIVAMVDESGESRHVVRTAVRLAEEHGARIIFYDATGASSFSDPVPGPVSAEGAGDQFGDPLDAGELDRLGRPALAEQVRAATEAGVEASAKLASEHGVEPLMRYAAEKGADLVVLPAELDDPGFLDRVRGETLDEAEEIGSVPIVVVDRTGNLG
jgi:nucleotide-binding universal stress UspA family protein